ncbi:hypothetical protein ABW19_dt0201258 [Dactylella cylindrospora]|nr:hypothetical protein ABW19_dt0201258 [Dactylella cylindrospora]
MATQNGAPAGDPNDPAAILHRLPRIIQQKDREIRSLIQDRSTFAKLRQHAEYSDFTILVGPEEVEIKGHRAIVCTKSPVFKAACSEKFQEGIDKQIKLPDILPDAMDVVMKWLYETVYDLPQRNDDLIFRSYVAADYLEIDSLQERIIDTIKTHLSTTTVNCKVHDPAALVERFYNYRAGAGRRAFAPLVHALIEYVGPSEFTRQYDKKADESFSAFLATYHFEWMRASLCGNCAHTLHPPHKANKCWTCGGSVTDVQKQLEGA